MKSLLRILCVLGLALALVAADGGAEVDHHDENTDDAGRGDEPAEGDGHVEHHGDDSEEGVEHHGDEHVKHWGYHGDYQPVNWGQINEMCDSNKRQSPIDVPSKDAIFDDELSIINTVQSLKKRHRTLDMTNNGHSVKIAIEHQVMVSGGNLGGGFRLAGIHFHWGSSDEVGSEHTVDSRRFPLEMHFVTYDSEHYGNLGDAVNGHNSLAVLGTLFKMSEEDNPLLYPIISGLSKVKQPGNTTKIDFFEVASLLPAEMNKYYRYMGSLTTPPCAESVIWSLFLHTQSISSHQLEQFRELLEPADGAQQFNIEDNWRPVQAIGKRHVYRSFLFKTEVSALSKEVGPEVLSGATRGAPASMTAAVLLVLAALFV